MRIAFLATLLGLGTAPLLASAAEVQSAPASDGRDPSFSFVNLDTLFKNLPQTKSAQAKIEEEKAAAKKEYETRFAAYKKLLAETEKLQANLAALPPNDQKHAALSADHAKASEALKKQESELMQWRQEREMQIQQSAAALREHIVTDIKGAMGRLSQNVNLVLDFSGMSLGGVPFVLLHPGDADLTPRLAAALAGKDSPSVNSIRGLRVATVDLNGIFKQLHKTKEAEGKINAAREAARQENDRLTSAVEAERAKLGPKPEPAQQGKVTKLETELNEFRNKKALELQQQVLEFRQPIVAEMARALEKIAGGQASLLFDVSGMSVSGTPLLVWTKGLPDFSASLVASLNGEEGVAPGPITGVPSDGLRFGLVDYARIYKSSGDGRKAEAEIADATKNLQNEMAKANAQQQVEKQEQFGAFLRHKRGPVLEKITGAIREFAAAGNFNVILDASGNTSNMTPVVLSARDVPDLTEEVIAKLNAPTP